MARKRRPHAAGFKGEGALAAVRGVKTTSELASEFGVHPTQIAKWKKQLLEGSAEIFSRNGSSRADEFQQREAELYQQIGKLQMPLCFLKRGQWLKKRLPASTEAKRSLVEPEYGKISLRRQCELLGLPRTSWYRRPAGESAGHKITPYLLRNVPVEQPDQVWSTDKQPRPPTDEGGGRPRTVVPNQCQLAAALRVANIRCHRYAGPEWLAAR